MLNIEQVTGPFFLCVPEIKKSDVTKISPCTFPGTNALSPLALVPYWSYWYMLIG